MVTYYEQSLSTKQALNDSCQVYKIEDIKPGELYEHYRVKSDGQKELIKTFKVEEIRASRGKKPASLRAIVLRNGSLYDGIEANISLAEFGIVKTSYGFYVLNNYLVPHKNSDN